MFCSGQKIDVKAEDELLRIKLAKQSAIDNFEVEIQSVPYPAVRSLIRYQMASWLWKDGKDDTGYAVRSAVKAFEELQENDRRCSDTCLKILVLLESHSPATKKRLVEKYKIDSAADLESAYFLSGQNSERSIADKLIRSFENGGDILQAEFLIDDLVARNSPELPRVLEGLLNAEERGWCDTNSLFQVVEAFRNRTVSDALRNRLYLLAVRKGFAALTSDEDELNSAYNLIYAIAGDIPRSNETLFSQVSLLQTALKAQKGERDKESEDVFERIEKSSDKLAATIDEAEAAENKDLKHDLYTDAFKSCYKYKKIPDRARYH